MKKKYHFIFSTILLPFCSYSQNIFPSSGNVGIGTTNPGYPLQISGRSVPLALRNDSLYSQSSSGETSIYFGDSASGVKMLRASKRTFNTRAFEIWTEYGYNVPFKAAEFYYNNLNFYTANQNRFSIDISGNVGIGTANPDSKLSVAGAVHAQAIKVDMSNWPDYVFRSTYHLPELRQVKEYIDTNHHLPDMPSAAEISQNGIDLGEMNRLLTKKVEELTLYLIDLKKDNAELNNRLKKLEYKK